jgi:acetylglutamate kinase
VVAVLAGLVNKQLVASLQAMGGKAIGLSGVDGGLLQARVLNPELGFVGEVVQVCPDVVHQVLEGGWIPVLAPLALQVGDDSTQGAVLNINGDTAAGALAAALEAERLIFLTDVEGVLDSSRRLIPRILPGQARSLIAGGVVSGGMIPKVEACLRALPHVASAQIVDGRKPHALLGCLNRTAGGTLVG